jgi:hypothetical protein
VNRDATLDVTQNSVAMRSRVYSIKFTFQEPYSSMIFTNPSALAAARKTKQPVNLTADMLPDGSHRYAIVTSGARTTVEFEKFRAHDRKLEKYQQWTTRVAEE